MNLKLYTQDSLFDELQPEWNALLERSQANRIFSTWEWQSTWWEAYHPGQLWVIVCRDADGRLLGIAPWFIEDNPKRGRVIRSIGCVDVTDYLDVIIDAACIEAVLNCFASFLAEHRAAFDLVDLCNIPEYSLTYQKFPTILEEHHFTVEVKPQEVCPVITLPDSWEGYLESLPKKQRHEVRRKLRRAEEAPENIAWYIVGESHNLGVELDRFLSLMAASAANKAEFLEDSRNTTFFRNIVPAVYKNGWLQLTFLTVAGQAAAAYLNFDYDNRVLVYNSGLLPDAYGHLSPGIVLLAHNIRHAIETGHQEYDFLRGNEPYKYRMGGQDVAVHMLMARPNDDQTNQGV